MQSKRKNEKIGGNVAEDEEAMEPFNDEELLLDLNKEYKNKYLSSIEPARETDVAAIKKKVFAMPPISLDEAISSLEYVGKRPTHHPRLSRFSSPPPISTTILYLCVPPC